MADPMTPAEWRRALTAEGVPFTELEGWTTRGRDQATGKLFGPVYGVLNHHTAGTSSLNLIAYRGQGTAVPPPLAHAYLPKSGRLVLVADGRANHAGTTTDNILRAIIAEKPIPKPDRSTGIVDGNDALYGIETENRGDGKDPYTRAQYDTLVRFNAAICRHHRWRAGSSAGHLETSLEGKVDPRGPVEGYGRRGRFNLTMKQLRADINERLDHPASWNPAQPPAPQEVNVEGPSYLNLGIDGYTLAPGLWDEISFTEEWNDELGQHAANSEVFAVGPARFTGTLSLRFEGLPVGDVVQVRMSEWEGSTLKHVHPIHEVIGTAGGAFTVLPLTKRLGSGRSMRIRLLNQSSGGIEVASAVLTALIWKES